ncbi:MAG: FAD-dependent oxidoreductase, partial [Prolixibacteraceae bacterium]|nr:FAD-dependent oxidoreductase [Prolixibacteraceae bacterium]
SLLSQSVLIEAESFNYRGGWVNDQQSIDIMGSAYLMAHGLGVPVEDAHTYAHIPGMGEYRVWVRTRNWIAPWNSSESPGKFRLIINDKPLNTVFGTEGSEWHWQDGGTIHLDKGKVSIVLNDITGFNGRCDAIYLTGNLSFRPPEEPGKLENFRRDNLNIPDEPQVAGEFDLVVVGGGMAGICTAISAARLGCKVALVQNRPVLGGNNSSEVRVGLSGLIFQEPFPNLGKLVDEVGSVGHWTLWEAERNPDTERSRRILEIIKNSPEKKIHNAGPAGNYGDDRKLQVVMNEKNISLFLNTHIFKVGKAGDKIISVTGKSITTGEELLIKGDLFADCTGDGNLGFLAGADYRTGRESRSETGEIHAPEKPDKLVMGTSVQWYADKYDEPQDFPGCPWAIQFTEETCQHLTRGDWNWETGFLRDQVDDTEYIRDHALRAVYGNWDYLKNKSKDKERYRNHKLTWVAHIGGKRESRRVLGDIILKEQDVINGIIYPDRSFTTTWGIDLHYPKEIEGFTEEPFLSVAKSTRIEPYAVPYRCLYSRNLDNLFMAGRNVSVTHVVLGTIRVMRTGGMMGEVVGMAAHLATKFKTGPRGVYENHLDELKLLMEDGVGNGQPDPMR